jgi:RNA polymerase sigma-70 factor (ECF subfamily)
MSGPADKHSSLINEAVALLLSRASNSRGVGQAEMRTRVIAALEKYLFQSKADADRVEIRQFIEEIRADDLCLIMACERGDEIAWQDLISAFDHTVKSAARKICSSAEEAEDLASSIWAELYGLKSDASGQRKTKLAYYSGRGSLAGWLRAVVAQLAVDQFRKQSRFVQIEENSDFENLAEASSTNDQNSHLVAHSDDPEELLGDKQVSEHISGALTEAIESLAAEDRLILKLYYFDDLKLKDIARTFGYHEATASRKLVRIQNEVRKSVERSLRNTHGWRDPEIKEFLSDAAANMGLSVEKLLTVLAIAAVMQDLWS